MIAFIASPVSRPRLDRVDVDEELVYLPGLDSRPALHFIISCFERTDLPFEVFEQACYLCFLLLVEFVRRCGLAQDHAEIGEEIGRGKDQVNCPF